MRARTAVVCSVADQGVAALTNILVLVVAARLSTVADFARFSAVYLVFTVLLGVSGAYTGQPLVLRRGASDETRGACRSALGFTLLVSAVAGGLLAAVCAMLPGETARALTMLGIVLPVVLAQDTARYAFATLHAQHLALAADTLRLVCVLGTLAVQPHGTPAAWLVLVWGLSALPALLLSAAVLHRRTAGTPVLLKPLVRKGTSAGGSSSSSASAMRPASSPCSGSARSATPSSSAPCAAPPPSSARSTYFSPRPPASAPVIGRLATERLRCGPPPRWPPSWH